MLDEIKIIPKKGNEYFCYENSFLDISINDYWSWAQSNLIENRTRGILAEFIVKKGLNIESDVRIEWDDYDLITRNGKRIEVKSAAYIQTWKQNKFSSISFDIEPKKNRETGKLERNSDYYLFCLLHHKTQNTLNPMNLEQWTFYVLETNVINQLKNNQKKIGLNPLLEMNPLICDFEKLKTLSL